MQPKKLIAYSTGSSIKVFGSKLKKLNQYDSIAWGDSFVFLMNKLEIVPKYWAFIDPHSIINGISLLYKRKQKYDITLIVLTPIMNSLKDIQKHCGTPKGNPYYKWKQDGFQKLHKDFIELQQYIKVVKVPATSYRSKYFDDLTDFQDRMWNLLQGDSLATLPVNGYSGDKLHTTLLPIVTRYLDYDEIYLAGFDGKGPRYDHSTTYSKEWHTARSQDKFLPLWNKWLPLMNKKVFNLIPSKYCRTNKFFPYKSIDEFLDELNAKS